MEQRRYFKMYKSGKQWVIASMALTGTVVLMGVSTAHADTTTPSNNITATQAVTEPSPVVTPQSNSDMATPSEASASITSSRVPTS